jgi:hypothetical protein
VLALVNDARLRAGQPPVGFVNPWLYMNPSALNDIVDGGSLGCSGTDLQSNVNITGAGIIPYASWNATVGWDPVTGLGTPNFQAMKASALSAGGNSSMSGQAPSPSGSAPASGYTGAAAHSSASISGLIAVGLLGAAALL